MTAEERYRTILGNHLPLSAVDRVYDYLFRHKVHFHITLERRTKLGDYRRPSPDHNFHEISINGDLNPYFFLWVFLHEAAHLETYLKYTALSSPPTPSPHGHEWQEEYRQLLLVNADLFPDELQLLLKRYTRRIPLSHPVAKQIEALLHHYDADYDPADRPLTLDDLRPGDRFSLKNRPQQQFEALERRRTRWLCREIPSGRQYLVAGSAQIISQNPLTTTVC